METQEVSLEESFNLVSEKLRMARALLFAANVLPPAEQQYYVRELMTIAGEKPTRTTDKLLSICAEKLGRAELRIHELEQENANLAQSYAHKEEWVRENDALWQALAYVTCDCLELPEKQIEFSATLDFHKDGCRFIEEWTEIKEAVKP